MTTVHFIGRDNENIYHLIINGSVFNYNRLTDKLTDKQSGKSINRLNLPGYILEAFHQAWDPEGYAAALKTPPVNEYGLPKASEDPLSPLYHPAKPEGEPAEIISGYHRSRHRRGVRNPH